MRIGLVLASILLLGNPIANAQDSQPTITINDAQYGRGNDVDATSGVRKLCNKLTSCSFIVDPGVMKVSDPAPGQVKDLRISWSCGKRGMRAQRYQDFQKVELSCEE